MSWADAIKGVLFETQRVPETVKVVEAAPRFPPEIQPISGAPGYAQTHVTVVSSVDPKPFEAKIRSKLTDPAYLKFVETGNALKDIITNDEAQLVKGILKVLGPQGIGVKDVQAALVSSNSVIAAEATSFSAVLAQQKDVEVKGREKKIADIDQQIQGLKEQRTTLATEMLEQKNKLNAAEAGFEAAKKKIEEELAEITGKLNLYTGSGNPTAGGTNA